MLNFADELLIAKGIQGPQGEVGPQGPQGPAGVAGADGKSAYQTAVESGYSGTETAFNEALADVPGHIASKANPHEVTKTQVGLSNVDNVKQAPYTHVSDKANPHGVTKAQVGLGNVDNTSDVDKPVSTAQQTAINACKVKKASVTLTAAGWTGDASPYAQTITLSGITVNSKVDIQMDATVLGVILDSGTSALWIENNNGTLTAKAMGEKPNADMAVQVMITEIINGGGSISGNAIYAPSGGGGFVASATAPDTKLLWIDTANGGIIKYHNGTAWVAVGAAFS